MAVFDSREGGRVTLDDTQALLCNIEAAENVQGHTVYIMRVQRGPPSESAWQISRRYSDFDGLNSALLYSGIDLPLPPKKVFGKLEREFVAERQLGLQTYINAILKHPLLSTTIYVRKFLDPDHYSFNFLESSLQHVSMVFRSELKWEIVEPLPDIGWRIRKQYFLVKSKSDPKQQQFILSWMSFGPDKYLEDKDLCSAFKLLAGIQHPYVYPVTFACASEKGGLVIYDFLENGTLRDLLCKAKPRAHYLKKYGKPKSCSPLDCQKIQLFGRQILIALKFLQDRGLHHGNLHSGNIVIVNGTCKLLEVTNCVLGVPCILRPYIVQLKKVQTVESVDVYCFGHLLYEMAFGSPLHSPSCDTFPINSLPELRSVLEAILTKEACKNGLPSVSDLLQHPFFRVSNVSDEKIHFKVPSLLKESLRKSKEQIEQRLKEEQKAIRHAQRISKVHAQLTSEEERRKRQSERKKQRQMMEMRIPSQNGPSPSPTPSDSLHSAPAALNSAPLFPPPPPPPPTVTPVTPPPPPPPATPLTPPPPLMSSQSSPPADVSRSALLSSIQSFSKEKLKKSVTVDKSAPKL